MGELPEAGVVPEAPIGQGFFPPRTAAAHKLQLGGLAAGKTGFDKNGGPE